MTAGRPEPAEQAVRARQVARINDYLARNPGDRSIRAEAASVTADLDRRPRVLFCCAHNAGRSGIAVALAAHRAAGRIEADSAGTTPDPAPSATTIATLAEVGIDGAGHQPKAVTADLVAAADVVVAMKPGLDLPQLPGVRHETWSLPDPAEWDAEGIRPLREEIDRRVQALIAELTQEHR